MLTKKQGIILIIVIILGVGLMATPIIIHEVNERKEQERIEAMKESEKKREEALQKAAKEGSKVVKQERDKVLYGETNNDPELSNRYEKR